MSEKMESDKETIEKALGLSRRAWRDALWTWFGLGRASFLTMPRVLMHAMPDEWQGQMAALLEQYDATFSEWPDGWESSVQLRDGGKFIEMPEWLMNYRHPDSEAINRLRPNSNAHVPNGAERKEVT